MDCSETDRCLSESEETSWGCLAVRADCCRPRRTIHTERDKEMTLVNLTELVQGRHEGIPLPIRGGCLRSERLRRLKVIRS